jgi:hypothetical protein
MVIKRVVYGERNRIPCVQWAIAVFLLTDCVIQRKWVRLAATMEGDIDGYRNSELITASDQHDEHCHLFWISQAVQR